MRKYRILLAGGDEGVMEYFLKNKDNRMECFSSSMCYPDLFNHIKYFQPDAVVFCMGEETHGGIDALKRLHENVLFPSTPLIIISDTDRYINYMRQTEDKAELFIKNIESLQFFWEKIISYLEVAVHNSGYGIPKVSNFSVAL